MAKVIDIVTGKPRKPPAKKAKRKRPDEWRALNRSHRVRDGRALILAIRDPRRPGSFIIGEAYFHVATDAWFWANTSPDLPGCDAIADVLDLTGALWRPMVQPPMALAA